MSVVVKAEMSGQSSGGGHAEMSSGDRRGVNIVLSTGERGDYFMKDGRHSIHVTVPYGEFLAFAKAVSGSLDVVEVES